MMSSVVLCRSPTRTALALFSLLLCVISCVAALSDPQPDSVYEQVQATRYLTSLSKGESSTWPVLDELTTITDITPLSAQYVQTNTNGVWLLSTTSQAPNAVALFFFDVQAKQLQPILTPQVFPSQSKLYAITTDDNTAFGADFFVVSPQTIYAISCAPQAPSQCHVVTQLDLSTHALQTILAIEYVPFQFDATMPNGSPSLLVGTDSGLLVWTSGTQTTTFPYNNITEAVHAITYSDLRRVLFFGTSVHLWIVQFDLDSQQQDWRFEQINGLIDAPITALQYQDIYQNQNQVGVDKLWIGQGTGITWYIPTDNIQKEQQIQQEQKQQSQPYQPPRPKLVSNPTAAASSSSQTTSSGPFVRFYFRRLAGKLSDPGSDVGGLPYYNITTLTTARLYNSVRGASSPIAQDGRMWAGSIYAALRYDTERSNVENSAVTCTAAGCWNAWRVFNSARYLPHKADTIVNVLAIAVLPTASLQTASGNTAVVLTAKGLSVLTFEPWTLQQKAEFMQTYLNQPLRHDRNGFVSGCSTNDFGNGGTCIKGWDDNDGLWTSMYVGSQVMRLAVEQDVNVLAQIGHHFQALHIQNQVTGILGYPARSWAFRTDFPIHQQWYDSPVYSNLQYKGDTSSDEITGHEYIYPFLYDILTSAPIQQSMNVSAYINVSDVLSCVVNITRHIQTHNWYLIGEKGVHTTWGIWNPQEMNNNPFYQETRGLNPLQVLAFLIQTFALTADQTYFNGLMQLIEEGQYDIDLINQKMIAICDGDFSDDELAYLAYFNFLHGLQDIEVRYLTQVRQRLETMKAQLPTTSATQRIQQLKKIKKVEQHVTALQSTLSALTVKMRLGLDLSHRYKYREKAPFYNYIYCYMTNQTNSPLPSWLDLSTLTSTPFDCSELVTDSISYLQRWPLELFDYPQINANRQDIHINVDYQCGDANNFQSIELLPPDERNVHKWNSSPFDLNDGSGFNEDDPAAYLLGYWGLRFMGLLN